MSKTQKKAVELPAKRMRGDTVEDVMTESAYHDILPARYLNKDEEGTVTEDQEEIFSRVAKNVALAEVVFKAQELDISISGTPEQIKPGHARRGQLAADVFGWDTTEYSKLEDIPRSLDDAHPHLQTDEVLLNEENINNFAYKTVIPRLDDEELISHVQSFKDDFLDQMESLSFIPNSPTLMNAGGDLQQLSACFVMSPDDDISSIHTTAKEAAEVFQSGGGVGYAFTHLRPYGDAVGSTGGVASGPITFMRTYDQMCETIAQGGTRRGAQMGVMRVSHPDIIQFIHAKNKDVSLAHTLRLNDPDDYTHNSFADALEEARDLIDEQGRVPKHLRNAVEGHLSNFNISVGITDEFMQAVKDGGEYTFTNPRTDEPHIATEKTKELYDLFGLGSHVDVGSELSIPANLIWERIVEGAHENGEPGVLFLERANKQHSFDVDEHPEYRMHASNPCGEQYLMEYEACNLGHINLSTLAAMDAPDWRVWSQEHAGEYDTDENAISAFLDEAVDWDELNSRIEIGTRFLDNVVTMSNFPVDQIQETVTNNRKIGLGIMGLAQLYIQLGIQYGSGSANEVAKQLMTHINHQSKEVSSELAQVRGSFEAWEDSKYAAPLEYPQWFEHHTGLEAGDWANGFPIRNHNTTTIAPTGTTSMVANTTGGCEPLYNVAYFKNVSEDVQGDEMLVEFDDYFLRVLDANGIDVESVKLEAEMLMNENKFDGVDSLQHVPEEIANLFVTAGGVSAEEHAKIQCALQEGVDSSISKTVNAPVDSTLEDAKTVFEYIYDNGGKGVTYYRDGTRSKQVLTTRADNTEFASLDEVTLGGIISLIRDNFDGMDEFLQSEEVQQAIQNDVDRFLDIVDPQEIGSGYVEKRPRPDVIWGPTQQIETGYGKVYIDINEDRTGEPFEVFIEIGQEGDFVSSFATSLGKIISIALRCGVDPQEIADQLKGIRAPRGRRDNEDKIHSIPDAVGKALQRHIDGDILKDFNQMRIQDLKDEVGQSGEINSRSNGASTVEEDSKSATDRISNGQQVLCPKCNVMSVIFTEGCKECESCGWSEC